MFSPTSPKAGEVVTVTRDAAASTGIFKNFTTVALSQGTVGTPGYVRIQVYINTDANANNSGTFVMPVLPAPGTWDIDVNSSGAPQGFGTLTYGGAGDWVCATDWDQAIADSRTFCEQRFTKDDSLTVPADVTSLDFLVVGGGGGGGGALNDTSNSYFAAGGGGGGGQVTVCTKSVTPSNVWTVTVGTGGTAGTEQTDINAVSTGNGGNGTDSTVALASVSCTAKGGQGGGAAAESLNITGPSRLVHGGYTPVGAGKGGASGSAKSGGDFATYYSAGFSFSAGGGGGHSDLGGNGTGNPEAANPPVPWAGGYGGSGWSAAGLWSDLGGFGGGGGGGGVGNGDPTYSAAGGMGLNGGGNGTSCTEDTGFPSCSGGQDAAFTDNLPRANSGGGGGGGAAGGGAAAGAAGIVIARYEVGGTPPPPSDPTLYVHQTNTIGGGSCASPDFATIAGAIAAAVTGDTIVVCSGTYQEGALSVPSTITELTIKGEVYPAPSDPTAFPAVGPQADAPVLDGTSTDRILAAEDTYLHLENLTMKNGKAPSSAPTGGGALRVKRVALRHMEFTDNATDADSSGGAVLAVDGSPANTAVDPTVDIQSSRFTNNSSTLGGGAVSSTGYVAVDHSAFDGNSVTNTGNWAFGGAISTGNVYDTGAAPLTVTASSFTNNSLSSGNFALGVAVSGGVTTLTNVTMSANSATTTISNRGYGAAFGSQLTLHFTTVLDNPLTQDVHATDSLNVGGSIMLGGGSCQSLGTYLDEGWNLLDHCSVEHASSRSVIRNDLTFGALTELNGSGTLSNPLGLGNTAIDFAACDLDGVLTTALNVDQNGKGRPAGASCDAGASEYWGDGAVWIERAGQPVPAGTSCDAPPFFTITAALAYFGLQSGDIVKICPGMYQEAELHVPLTDITLEGTGTTRGQVVIDARNKHRVVDATGLTLTLRNVTVQNGYVVGNLGQYGGAAVMADVLTLDNVGVLHNRATWSSTGDSYGAAISAASVTVTDSEFRDNTGSTRGGAIYTSGSAPSTITGSSFASNSVHANEEINSVTETTRGGAVYATGPLTIDSSYFIVNAATSGGAVAGLDAVTITDSFFDSNLTTDTAGEHTGGALWTTGATSISGTSFSYSYIIGSGQGAAIWTSAPLTIDSSTFADSFGQDAYNPNANLAVGTIYSTSTAANPDVSITNSTFRHNSLSDDAVLHADGTASLLYVTVVENANDDGASVVSAAEDLTLTNSLFALNLNRLTSGSAGCEGVNLLLVPSSVSDESTCASSPSVIAAADFGQFTYHGTALTQTLELASGNPAIGAADCALAGTVTVDQNGSARTGPSCEAGAFEYVAPDEPGFCPEDGATVNLGVDPATGRPICQRVYESGEDVEDFVVPAGVGAVDVVLVGAGGGGGGGGTDAAGEAVMAGGGGGAGAVSLHAGVSVTPLASIPVTVGAAGSGGVGGAVAGITRGGTGTDGGSSAFLNLTASGGTGGTGGGESAGTYYVGAGGSTPAGPSGASASGAHSGAAGGTVPAWDDKYWYTAGGGGAGSGGDGASGLYGPRLGLYASTYSGAGGQGFVPSAPASLFGSPQWVWSLGGNSGFTGLAMGGTGGVSGVVNSDTYTSRCDVGASLHSYGSESPDTGFGSAMAYVFTSFSDPTKTTGVITGTEAEKVKPTNMGPCQAMAAGAFGSGGSGGIGSNGFQIDGTDGKGGAVIMRYLAPPVPECGEDTGTATESNGFGYGEMIVTGKCEFVAPAGVTSADIVAIGGGGAGGASYFWANGGGGGGEVSLCTNVSTDVPAIVRPGKGGLANDDSTGGDPSSVMQGTNTLCGAEGGEPGGLATQGCSWWCEWGAPQTNGTVRVSPFARIDRSNRGPLVPDPNGVGAGDGGDSGGLSGNAGGLGSLSYDGSNAFAAAGGGGGGAGAPGAGSRLNKRAPITMSEPDDISFSAGDSQMFVTSYGSHNIRVFDTASETVVQTFDFGAGQYPWAAVQSGNKLYVSMNTGGVRVLDYDALSATPLTNASTISVPGSNTGIAVAGDGRIFVAQNAQNKVAIIDPANSNAVTYVSVGTGPWGVVAAGNYVFVSNNQGGTITLIDTANSDALYTHVLGVGARPLNMTIYNGVLYVGGKTDGLWTIDAIEFSGFGNTQTLSATTLVTTLEAPVNAVEVSPDGLYLYAAMNSVDKVLMLDRSTGLVLETLTPAEMDNPWDVEANPATGVVYVSNENSSTVSSFEFGCPQPSFVDSVNPVAPASTVCYPSTGGAGAVLGQLTGASSSLFDGDTRAFGGGGGGGSTNQFDDNSNALTLGGVGGGGTGGYTDPNDPTASIPPTGGTEFGGGGGGRYDVISNGGGCGPFCGPVTRYGSVTTAAGDGAQGAVIIRWAVESNLKECAVTSSPSGITVSVIDIETDALDGGPVGTTGPPFGAVIAPDGTRAYVTTAAGQIDVVDLATRTVVSSIPTDSSYVDLTISADGATLYASTGLSVLVIDTATGDILATIVDGTLLPSPQEIALSPDGSTLFTYDNSLHKIVAIKTATNAIDTSLAPSDLTAYGTYTNALAISPDGTTLYLGFETQEDGLLVAVNAASGTFLKEIVLGLKGPADVVVSKDGSLVSVSDPVAGVVLVLDPTLPTGNTLATIPVAAGPYMMALSPSGKKLYVGHVQDPVVLVIDADATSGTYGTVIADPATYGPFVTTGYCVPADTGNGRVWIERDLGSGGVPVDSSGVKDDTVSCDKPTYTSITAAVAAAQAGDIIHVCSGTYREAEIVPTVDNLTIQGTQWVDTSGPVSDSSGPQTGHVGATLADAVIIDGELTEGDVSSRHRIFDATDLKISFNNVVLQNGSSDTYGGAVKAYQAVFVDSTVQDNTAPGGGAVFVSGQPSCDSPVNRFLPVVQAICSPVRGLFPLVAPSVTVTTSEFLRNGVESNPEGPVQRGQVVALGSIDGGAVYANDGSVEVTDSLFDANEAMATAEVPVETDGAGGAILAASVEVYGSMFTNNKALYHGGAISASSVTVRASTPAGVLVASTFESNEAAGDGTWDGYGGAIWADGVDVENASFVSNTSDNGAAIASAAQNDAAPVTSADPLTAGSVAVATSTFELNSASADGGAVLNKAVGGSTTVYNSTFSANHSGNAGGAVYAQNTLSVSFSTFDANTADVAGGVFWTPVAPSVDDNIFSFAAVDEAEAAKNGCLTYEWTPAKDVKNFTTNYWCPGTVVTSAELALSPVADNGGPTRTMAIASGSAALDQADQTECDSRTDPTDQRGNHRPVGKACDSGAYEYFGQVTLDAPPGQEGTFTSESGVKTLHILLVGGGGGGGAYGPNGEAGGGGGGGEVVECTVNLTDNQTVVTYYFGLGGAEGDDGEASWVKVGDEADPTCSAAGGIAGVDGGDGPGAGFGGAAGATAPAVGNPGGGAALCDAPTDCTTFGTQSLAGGGGGGAGGAGLGGDFDGNTSVATGGAGGSGVSPTSVAFGDSAVLYGGGGGGGAFCANGSSPGGNGGVGGGGDGVTGDCTNRPVRGNPPSYGGGPVGGGGGGGAGTISGGSGGGGTGEVRTPVPLGPDDIIHVCLNKLYVVYGASYFNPKVYYCVPEVDECAAPTSPTLTPVSGSDPECCPPPTAPDSRGSVSSDDPDHCCPVDAPVSSDDPNHCVRSPETESELPSDRYSTVSGDDVVESGSVSQLDNESEDDDSSSEEGETASPSAASATPVPLHYEHGIPDGWVKVNPEDYPEYTPPTCTTDYVQGMGVEDSPREIVCTGGDPGAKLFDYSFLDGGLRIHPAQLKVKPKHLRVPFDSPEPDPYEYTVRGFKLGEDATILTELPNCDSGYVRGDPAGTRYDITCEGGVAANYTFKYQRSHIHVEKVRVPLRAADRTVTYGDPVPEYGFGLSGLKGPDTLLSPERLAGFVAPVCSSTYSPTSSAGVSDIYCLGASSTNYEFFPLKGTVTVLKAPLTVVPRSTSVAYGTVSPSLGFDLVGFVNGETVPGSGYSAPKCVAVGYSATAPAGSQFTVSCTGGSARNYALDEAATSTLTVGRAGLTVVPNAVTVPYGSTVAGYSATVTGWRNGESPLMNPAGFVMPVCGSTHAPSDAAGSVSTIVCTGGSADNYDVDVTRTSTVTVAKATLTVTPTAVSTTYGQAVPALSFSVDGFVNGEAAESASGFVAPKCTTTAIAGSNAGSYPITCTGGAAANYQFVYAPAVLTVNKAVLRAVPANASVVYGSGAPTVPLTVSGFVNAQTATSAAGFRAPTCSAPGYTVASNVGVLPITCTGGSATNYTFDNTAVSSLTVTKAAATITAVSRSVVYGTVGPVFGFTVSGLKNGQTAGTVAGLVVPNCVSGYTPLTNAGLVPAVTCSGASSTNYSFTYVAGKVTVTKATLTVTPDAKGILKGAAVPTYTYVVTGWQNAQGPTTAAGYVKPVCKSSYSTRSAVGSYTISCSSGAATNYVFVYRTALLTVR